jgi:methyltransferase
MNPDLTRATLPAFATGAALLMMLAELVRSRANERGLRARGAVEPADDVYRAMAWAYPLGFIAMGVEGAWFGPHPGGTTLAGAAVFVGAKALKFWAIAALGTRWTFRVLVLPGAPLVTNGPYAWLRHPNYVAVIGELTGFALLVGAPVTGLLAAAGFGGLIWRRIAVEEQALGRSRSA